MSDAQQEHALAVERLAPRLAALRIELCPGYMSESCFWKIYFVLLHPRLNKQDAELLSTPEIVKARALLSHELKNRNATMLEESQKKSLNPEENALSRPEEPLSIPSPVLSENQRDKASAIDVGTSTAPATSEIAEHSVERNEIQIVDNTVSEEKDVSQVKDQYLKSASSNLSEEKDEDDADDWLKEETSEVSDAAGNTIKIENDEDVSFSDLEEDDGDIPTSYRKSNYSSDRDSRDWVQLGKSSSDSSKDMDAKHSDKENANDHDTKESNDWLDVDDIVVD
ncbi:hypothetical protein CDL12_10419 [Handroanthus impetiginosus]|uniref:BSD domain-containing protein n=1 Tax=Handroanthus impetiginosus TaxID=429701 RepID=A0A2G9HHA4_9LAMI|nr:hypothetical protein CDL12_10419 [Handroanthus impetiginosus]